MKKFKWDKHYLYWGITAFAVVICSVVFFTALNRWTQLSLFFGQIIKVLEPVIYGLVIAYLLTPLVKLLENKVLYKVGKRLFPDNPSKSKNINRVISILASVLIALLVITVLLTLFLPELYKSIESLATSLPIYFNESMVFITEKLKDIPELQDTATNLLDNAGEYILNWIQTSLMDNVQDLITRVTSSIFSFLGAISNIAVGLIFSIYVIYNREMFAAQIKKILYSIFKPKDVRAILNGVDYVDKSFGGFIIGKLLDSAIIGVICFIFMSIVNMPYATLVSVVVGITNMIPFFGPFIGAIPSAILILMESPIMCLVFVIFIIVLQQIDGNILGPKILSSTTGLNGFWVMFAIIVGGGLFGILGMFCGVPVFSIIYACVKYLISSRLEKKKLPVDTNSYYNPLNMEDNSQKDAQQDNQDEG